MAVRGYTTSQRVATFLGQGDLTREQATALVQRMAAAERLIEHLAGGRAWLVGAQTNEAHWYPGHEVWLRYPPVTSVASVTGRAGVGSSEDTLVVNQDYELREAENGLLWLVSPAAYDRVRVTYTPVADVPEAIVEATTRLIAYALRPALLPDSYGVRRFQLPDLAVDFASAGEVGVPDDVRGLVESVGHRVVV